MCSSDLKPRPACGALNAFRCGLAPGLKTREALNPSILKENSREDPRLSSQRRYFFFVPLFLAACALLGGFFGPGAQTVRAASQRNASPTSDDDLRASIEAFTKVYDVVDQNYADKLSADKAIYRGAIPGMLRTLDPHSNFFDPKEFAGLREEQHGKYFGVGMTIAPQPRSGKTMVVHPFGGTPAYKAGLRPGDMLLEINEIGRAHV